MKNIKNFALVGVMALALAACGNDQATTENADPAAAPKVGEATVEGYGGDLTVKVTLDAEGKIESIDTNHTETEGIGADAITVLEADVIANNGTEGVDNISGSTITSKAFKEAIDEAVANAK